MPDIPIDTLVIIGLVIASFVGKFFQKKSEESPAPKKSPKGTSNAGEKSPTLRDVLKEAWERANQPEIVKPEFSEPSPSHSYSEMEETDTKDVNEIPAQENLPQAVALKKAESEPTNSSERRSESGHSWVKKELLSDSNSLKRAFVLKEILDKPKSLKSLSS